MNHHRNTSTEFISYEDDLNYIISDRNKDKLERYTNELFLITHHLFKIKMLKMKDKKSQVLQIE